MNLMAAIELWKSWTSVVGGFQTQILNSYTTTSNSSVMLSLSYAKYEKIYEKKPLCISNGTYHMSPNSVQVYWGEYVVDFTPQNSKNELTESILKDSTTD